MAEKKSTSSQASTGSRSKRTPSQARKSTSAKATPKAAVKTTTKATAKPAPKATARPATDAVPSQSDTAPAAPPLPKPRNSVWPMVLGGGLAAGLGFVTASLLPSAEPSNDIAARLSAIEATQDELRAGLAGQGAATVDLAPLEAGLADLRTDLDAVSVPQVDLTPITAKLDALDADLAAQANALSDLQSRIAMLEARPEGIDVSLLGANGVALDQQIATLQALVDSQRGALEAVSEDAETELAALRETITSEVARLQASSAIVRLTLAMESGAPFAAALSDAEAGSGISAPALLHAAAETGLVRLSQLRTEFASFARDALPIALRETAGDTMSARVGAFLQGQIGGRSLSPRDGDDPDAILSRAQGAVDQGDLSLSLAELSALPAPAQAVFSDWVAQVEARLSVTEAFETYRAAIGQAG
ncbi:COG4223 family protein [Roseobacter sp. HKCCD5988]|uniref:COG4223 family protein n=1 Tax=Roseobacter sp. HKCCD5988 TaxID=3120338 RepID=UPI0030EDC6E1